MVLSFLGGRGGSSGGPPDSSTEAAQRDAAFRPARITRAYWQGIRDATGTLPLRGAVDPRGLAGALDHVFVAERIGSGLIRLRIAGMGLTDLAGLDMKGLPLSTLFLPEARVRLAQVVERVCSLPVAAELHLEAERGIGRPALEARLVLLPLVSSRGVPDLVLGCLPARGQIGRAPRRFAIARVIEERILLPGLPGIMPPDSLFPKEAPAPVAGFSEAPAPAPVKTRPHLRLVHSVE